jgi:hypothetical protein
MRAVTIFIENIVWSAKTINLMRKSGNYTDDQIQLSLDEFDALPNQDELVLTGYDCPWRHEGEYMDDPTVKDYVSDMLSSKYHWPIISFDIVSTSW